MKTYLALLCGWGLMAAGTASSFGELQRAEGAADAASRTSEAPESQTHAKRPHGFTPEREAAAMEFVRRHHPELALLLAHLKKTDTREYQRAVSSLFSASERLAEAHQRGPKLYERELREWKLKSRIQLLVAQIRLTPADGALRQALRQALLEQLQLRSARLVAERNALADRLKKLDQRIEELEKNADALAERQLETLLRERKKPQDQQKSERGKQSGDVRS